MREMTRKQEKFVAEYMKDQNGTAAAIRAGYGKKTARQAAARMLTFVNVKKEVEARLKAAADKAQVSAEWITERLKLIAERCVQEVDPIMKANGVYKRDRNTGKVCFDFDSAGASRALELLGKTRGMFIDKHDVSVAGRMVIVRPKR
jgi:phage terminase small subunit